MLYLATRSLQVLCLSKIRLECAVWSSLVHKDQQRYQPKGCISRCVCKISTHEWKDFKQFLNGPFPATFSLFFNKVDSKQMFNINFADDWIRTRSDYFISSAAPTTKEISGKAVHNQQSNW